MNANTKIKFGELADSIISKDYCPSGLQIPKSSSMQIESITNASDQWKPNICIARKDEHQKQMYDRVLQSDDRQLKGSLSISPRPKPQYLIDSSSFVNDPKRTGVGHSLTHPHTLSHHQSINQSSEFALDYYVKSRIAEAMRTEVDKRQGEEKDIQLCVQASTRSIHQDESMKYSNSTLKMQDNETAQLSADIKNPMNSLAHLGPFPSQHSYAYPYSALNMTPNTSSSLSVKPVCPPSFTTEPTVGPGLTSSTLNEPKPLLSSQYEALSDED